MRDSSRLTQHTHTESKLSVRSPKKQKVNFLYAQKVNFLYAQKVNFLYAPPKNKGPPRDGGREMGTDAGIGCEKAAART
jgi:hypothetical protein